jgi:hypothetical protein
MQPGDFVRYKTGEPNLYRTGTIKRITGEQVVITDMDGDESYTSLKYCEPDQPKTTRAYLA